MMYNFHNLYFHETQCVYTFMILFTGGKKTKEEPKVETPAPEDEEQESMCNHFIVKNKIK